MPDFTNIAGYKFVELAGLKEMRAELLRRCKEHGIKGTILLSLEGINLFLAGSKESIDTLLAHLRSLSGLEDFQVKFSSSAFQPFNRMLVRIKKEIIAFGVEGVNPARRPSPKISPRQLKEWLDQGRPVTLLDTRNDYEVKLGTFKNALPAGIDHFRKFPDAVRQLDPALKQQPIVMFCTGGIRCEKAGPFMEQEGFQQIYQLDGGILKYFEECGGDHYEGDCFVFDQRVGLDPALRESDSTQCYNCLTPLTADEQSDPRYVPGKSCPYCFQTSAEAMASTLATRHAALQKLIHPLPGSTPYDHLRPITVPGDCDGLTVGEFLASVAPHVPLEEWERLASRGLLLGPDRQPVSLKSKVQTGQRYYQKTTGLVEPDVNARFTILHEDEALIVLNKPAPLPMHPGGRFDRNTLQHLLDLLFHPLKPKPAHRLDANTTGVLLVTKTRHFAGRLQPQFARGEVRKRYLARVHGHPAWSETICEMPVSEGPGEAGRRELDPEGLSARTEFRLLRRNDDGTSLVESSPLTGRTNQIRLHLWSLGFPICGDATYLPGAKMAATQTLDIQSAPLCLHSWSITFRHPLTQDPITFFAPRPPWATE